MIHKALECKETGALFTLNCYDKNPEKNYKRDEIFISAYGFIGFGP